MREHASPELLALRIKTPRFLNGVRLATLSMPENPLGLRHRLLLAVAQGLPIFGATIKEIEFAL